MVLRMLRIIVLWRSLTNRLNRIKSSYGHIAYVARGNVVRPPARHHITKMKCNIVFLDIVVGVTLPISDHNNGPFLTIILNHLRFFSFQIEFPFWCIAVFISSSHVFCVFFFLRADV